MSSTQFLARGVKEHATNAALTNRNQIGAVTETIEAIAACKDAGWNYIISHRSGETDDTFTADFAVATGGDQIKTGSLYRSERIAKYNRLPEIERNLNPEPPTKALSAPRRASPRVPDTTHGGRQTSGTHREEDAMMFGLSPERRADASCASAEQNRSRLRFALLQG